MEENEWAQLIAGLRSGDANTCTDFWNEYGRKLQAVAQHQLSERLQRRVGPDDVVQSACRTFFRRMSTGQFDLPDADSLWRLMCAITLTKARRAARDHSRKKRGVSSEQYLDASSDNESGKTMELSGDEQSPLDAALFADQIEQLIGVLSPMECEVLDLKLQEFTNAEIADRVRLSERSVRRQMEHIRERWNALFEEVEE